MKIIHGPTNPYHYIIIDMADMFDGEIGEVQDNEHHWAHGTSWTCKDNMFRDVKEVGSYISRACLSCEANRDMCKVKVRRRR